MQNGANKMNPEQRFETARNQVVRLINDSETMTADEKNRLRANLVSMWQAVDALASRAPLPGRPKPPLIAASCTFRVGRGAR